MPAWNTTLDDFAGQPGWPGAQAVYGAFGTIEDVLQHGEDVDILHNLHFQVLELLESEAGDLASTAAPTARRRACTHNIHAGLRARE